MGSKDFINYKLDFFNEICENTHGRELFVCNALIIIIRIWYG